MGFKEALLSLNGLCIGDAFGASLNGVGSSRDAGPDAGRFIELRRLPPAPWRWTAETQLALSVVEELEQREWIDQDNLARRMAWRFSADSARGFGAGTCQVLKRIAQGEYFRSVSRNVYDGGSFGSLAASRAVTIGAYFNQHPDRAIRDVRLAVSITHFHPEGLAGAEAAAIAAVLAAGEATPRGVDFLREVVRLLPESRLRQGIQKAVSIPPGQVSLAGQLLGTGDKYTVLDSLPFALWCAAHHLDNFEAGLWSAASSGSKCSAICAIVGGLLALSTRSVPEAWHDRCEPLPRRINTDQRNEQAITGSLSTGSLSIEASYPIPNLAREPELVSIRTDPLTGLPNLLGLLDWMKRQSQQEQTKPFALVAIHLISLWDVNRSQGRTAGNDLLRTSARTLQAWAPGLVFRAGGDKFAIILRGSGGNAQLIGKAEQIVRLIPITDVRTANTAVIKFDDPSLATPGNFLACLYIALADSQYTDKDDDPCLFDATEICRSDNFPWLMIDLAEQMMRMGGTADESIRLAHTDSISQLPNMRAALNALDAAVNRARQIHEPLAILLIDGDNLRRYNQISYNAGDEAIRLLGRTLKSQLREADFIARWRTGDEFLIILPNTHGSLALQVGKRLCRAVELASLSWLFPSTISIGIAIFPEQGGTVQNLLDAAEQGLETAKQNGKNQVFFGKLNSQTG